MAKIIVTNGDLLYEGKTGRGGHIMYILQWLEGLRRLGHEVLYLEELVGGTAAIQLFADVMEHWWKPSLSALVYPSGEAAYGLNANEVEKFGRDAAALISLSATYKAEATHCIAHVHPRILIEQDPGFTHIWANESSPDDIFGCHDIYFTVGGNVGTQHCTVPTCGIEWHPIWNPVVLNWWNPDFPVLQNRFTTVASWWVHEYQNFEGKMWGPKAEQMQRFINLPSLVNVEMEIALDTSPDDPEINHLKHNGWRIESPQVATLNAKTYQTYVNGSLGEFTCAKGIYAGTKCGWFSDRSACYLAAGRPVVVQDTGFRNLLPVGEGLFAVNSVEEAAEAIRMITYDYHRHAKAARKIAAEHFDSDKIIKKMLDCAGISNGSFSKL
jgi:hypothetical protein